MATPPNPRVYMFDDWSWALGGTTAWQNFYVWDGHGALGQYGYGTGGSRGYGFAGESSTGTLGWTIVDLDTLFAITSATMGQCLGFNPLQNTTQADIYDFKEASGGPTHVRIMTDINAHIIAKNGDGTLLGTSDYIMEHSAADGSGPTNHIETIVTVSNTVGTVQVWVNDILVLDLSGKDTQNGGTGVIGYVNLYGTASRRVAEWIVHNGAARLSSQWRAGYVPVATAGTYTSQTSGTVADVNDSPASPESEDANYVVLDATGLAKKASFVSGAMPASALQVRDVHPQLLVKKSDGGTNTGKVGLKSGATEVYTTSAFGVPDAWVARRLALRTNPAAGTPLWTPVTAAAAEVIIDRES